MRYTELLQDRFKTVKSK